MLTLEAVHTYYGAAHVLFDVSLTVAEREIVCLLGRNGVGKTTCLRSVMGLTSPRSGSIHFNGRDISGLAPFQIARLGIGYVPEERRIFADLTVGDNLEIGMRRRNVARRRVDWAYEVFPDLARLEKHRGGELSGGEQQMLTIARTLMGEPTLLLIDEPTEGLSPLVVRALERLILDLKRQGQAMLLAAQNVGFATRVADRVCLMNRGRVVYTGTVEAVRQDEVVVRAHLAV